MNRENAKALLPIIEGYAEGKVVQVDTGRGNWRDIDSPSFGSLAKRYRLKPEPRVLYVIEVQYNNGFWDRWTTTYDVTAHNGNLKSVQKSIKSGSCKAYREVKFVEQL